MTYDWSYRVNNFEKRAKTGALSLPPALLVNTPLHAPEAYKTPLQPSAAITRPSYGYYDLEFDFLDTIINVYL